MVACLEKYFIKTIQVVAFAVYVLCKNDKNGIFRPTNGMFSDR